MKRINKPGRILVLAMVLCLMLTTLVSAAEDGMLWLSVTVSENGKDTTAMLVTDTTVTDGLVKVTYDPAKLTYKDLMVSSDYVAMHAVNTSREGELLISWVAPEAYDAEGAAVTLIEIHFEGADAASLALTGVAHDAAGNTLPIGNVDKSDLEKALADAGALQEKDYTPESWKALTDAVKAAQEILENPTATQAEADAAAKTVRDAIAALEEFVPADKTALQKAVDAAQKVDKKNYTEASYAALEKELAAAKAVLAEEYADQDTVDAAAKALNDAYKALVPVATPKPEPGGSPETGDNTMLGVYVVLAILSAGAIVFLLVAKNRKVQGR